MINLPKDLVKFCIWWLSIAPAKVFTLCKRILVFVNNEFAFTLNLRLMFTPIYGDYSIVGRIIGFVFRMIEIVFGIIFTSVIAVFMFVSPVLWWTLPLVITYYARILIVPVAILGFFLWKKATKNIPDKKVKQISKDNNIQSSFRPDALDAFRFIEDKNVDGISSIIKKAEIRFLLKKAELLNNEFIQKISETKTLNGANIAQSAYDFALKQNTRYVEIEHVFLGIITNIPKFEIIMATYNSTPNVLIETARWILEEREKLDKVFFWQEDYEMPKMGGVGRGMTGRVTPALDSISEDFTKKAAYQQNERYVIHKEEMNKVAEILGGSKVNVLITGEPGCGKTSIVKNMAYEIMRGTGYESLKFKRLISVQIGALLAGAKTSGDLAQKLRKAMDDVEASGDEIIFIDEIHNLVSGVSNENAETASIYSILEPYLSSGRIQFVGATSVENYRKYIEPNGSFANLFNIVEIPPSSKEETIEVIKVIAGEMEKQYGVFITYPALKKIVDLSEKLIHDRVFPDKAVDILTRTVSSSTKGEKMVDQETAAREISIMTKIPVASVTQDESEKLLNIEKEMKKRVIGQDDAIHQIGTSLKRARVGIRNESKPIASFLFVGTTGVGKTETAKALARTYFGDEKRMIRLDMSEYQQMDSINRLLGAPDGKSKGILTEAVRTAPFALILLDEIEKAYSSVLLAFLQVLDDGRLTDSTGRVVDFTNTIIIATSNVGTRAIQEISNNNGTFEEMQTAATKEVRDKFAPEFLNRFNGIIVFRPMTIETVKKIADIMLNTVRKIADDKGIKVTFKPELITELVNRGYNPQWGARPLARVIENTVESYLAVKLLSKEIKMGDEIELGMEVFDENNINEKQK